MRDVGVNLLRPFVYQRFGPLAQGARGIDNVVNDYADPVLHFPDHGHFRHFARALASLVDDRQRGSDALGQLACPRDAADIRRYHSNLVQPFPERMLDVERKDRRGVEVVDRHVEKALNLRRMQIHGQDTFDASAHDHVRDQLCRDGNARSCSPVLARIAEIRNDGSHALGGRAPKGIRHDQQFHQVVIGRV